jgi:hypothetical protein
MPNEQGRRWWRPLLLFQELPGVVLALGGTIPLYQQFANPGQSARIGAGAVGILLALSGTSFAAARSLEPDAGDRQEFLSAGEAFLLGGVLVLTGVVASYALSLFQGGIAELLRWLGRIAEVGLFLVGVASYLAGFLIAYGGLQRLNRLLWRRLHS